MNIEIITKSDLEALKQDLIHALTEFIKNNSAQQPKEWMRSREVRQLLGISAGTLTTLRIKGVLKGSKIEGTIYYRYSDIMQLLDAGLQ